MRITKERLANRFATLVGMMGWNCQGPMWTATPEGNRAHVGFIYLSHNTVYGWSIAQIVNEGGGESTIKGSCSAAEMDAWLGGAIFAADRLKRGETL